MVLTALTFSLLKTSSTHICRCSNSGGKKVTDITVGGHRASSLVRGDRKPIENRAAFPVASSVHQTGERQLCLVVTSCQGTIRLLYRLNSSLQRTKTVFRHWAEMNARWSIESVGVGRARDSRGG